MVRLAHIGLVALGAASCVETTATGGTVEIDRDAVPFEPTYLGIETRKLDDEFVSFLVTMKGARDKEDVAEYGKCAAAQYALIRGYGFARQLRTNVAEKGGIWRGDAVYTISAALPDGVRTIDAEVVVQDCKANGIPTV